MNWSPRVNPIKIRRLYRFIRLGIYNNVLLHDVGWELYDRCADIVTVADVFREGCVPCPECKTKVARKIDPHFSKGEGGTRENWFHCQHCENDYSGEIVGNHFGRHRDASHAILYSLKQKTCTVLVEKVGHRNHTSSL